MFVFLCVGAEDSVRVMLPSGWHWLKLFCYRVQCWHLCINVQYLLVFAWMPVPECVCEWGAGEMFAPCYAFSDFCVESDHKCVHIHPLPPPSPAPILLPFHPSLHHFPQRHQGLASWCLHCKSVLTIRRWLDPTHIQKHLIYLFIFPSCRASRCIIFDQGDIPTSKCYSLHQQVKLFTNKLKQNIVNEILMAGEANNRTSTERKFWFFFPFMHGRTKKMYSFWSVDLNLL